ncbi:U-megalopygitoxin(8)-Mc8-like [Choristoneura fumiferana]|uniref:U-megalopygitoxin(8)-Mc8-like n=1 Tax=Choristoneura fumiferana TaxID=7141 RepID=UPI003D15DAC8
MYWITFILLPGVLSEMTINIFGGPNPKVEVSGSQTDVISDAERSAFRINDAELKEAANKFYGMPPSDIFVRGPTPWDDLYKRYGWTEISRTLVPKNPKILSYRADQTVIASKNFHNDGSNPTTYSAAVTQLEENTVRHFWTRIGYATVTQKIDYNINVGNDGLVKIIDKNSFLEDSGNALPVTIGSKSSRNITLQSGETAVAVLTATKGEIDVEVEFEASLAGNAAANYALTYKGHHFWAFEINTLLDAAGLPKTVSWMETVTIGFFADEEVLTFSLNGTRIQ